MRLGVISDIHGNFQALEAVLAELDHLGIENIVSLGDNIGYGPEPEEVIMALVDRKIDSVMGNHELALYSPAYLRQLNFTTQRSLELTKGLMSATTIEFCRNLPKKIVTHDGRFVHGSPPESVTRYIWDAEGRKLANLFDSFSEKLCFFGHTHDPTRFVAGPEGLVRENVSIEKIELSDDCRYMINPGSVGQPRDTFDNRAKYAIWDVAGATFEQRAVAYDVDTTVALLRERGFPEFNATRLLPF